MNKRKLLKTVIPMGVGFAYLCSMTLPAERVLSKVASPFLREFGGCLYLGSVVGVPVAATNICRDILDKEETETETDTILKEMDSI